jgi:hypothetical protein
MPKLLKVPKPGEYRNTKSDGAAPTPQSKRPLAEIVYFPNMPGYQSALWLKLADSALHRRTARRKHLLQ